MVSYRTAAADVNDVRLEDTVRVVSRQVLAVGDEYEITLGIEPIRKRVRPSRDSFGFMPAKPYCGDTCDLDRGHRGPHMQVT
jgi:hypothetical protein